MPATTPAPSQPPTAPVRGPGAAHLPRRARRALSPLVAVVAALAVALGLVATTVAPVSAATTTHTGRLTTANPSITYTQAVGAGRLTASVSFSLVSPTGQPLTTVTRPTAQLVLRRPDGSVVQSVWGTSPLTISADVGMGSYDLELSTKVDLTNRALAYTATVDAPAYVVPSTPSDPALGKAACGTWVLYQVSSTDDLERMRSRILAALALPGVTGFSVRFPWDAVDMTGTATTHPVLDLAYAIAQEAGKRLSIRFMAGAHTPARVFDAGASYFWWNGEKVPLPWDNATGTNDVFLTAYSAYVRKLAAWSRSHGVSLLHGSWYGLEWAELNHGSEVRAAAGYTQDKWLQGHRELVDRLAAVAGPDLAVELPLSGYGNLSTGQSASLADHVMETVGARSNRFFLQANGWDETREWGSLSDVVESQMDTIWDKPIQRGLQMIQPDGYDWSRVFANARAVGATYAEVYLPSFWQVPGPTPQWNHNTLEKIAQLKQEVAAFGQRC